MSKRLWTGLLVGVLGAMALVAVGVGAFHAGERHTVTTVAPVVGTPGEAVRVVGYGHWGPGWGGPPFGFLFPLLIIGLIVLLVAGRRRAYWGRPWGPGPWGAGPGGWAGGPCGPGGKDAALADWHQRAHAGPQDAPQEAPPGTPGEA
ncbi:MAG: hypothetical protein ACRDYF_12775 [Acidimicrobiia bacterium]